MYADRVDAAAKTSIKDRLNGNSIGDSGRLRQFTGKRNRRLADTIRVGDDQDDVPIVQLRNTRQRRGGAPAPQDVEEIPPSMEESYEVEEENEVDETSMGEADSETMTELQHLSKAMRAWMEFTMERDRDVPSSSHTVQGVNVPLNDFMKLTPPTFTGTNSSEDPQRFLDDIWRRCEVLGCIDHRANERRRVLGLPPSASHTATIPSAHDKKNYVSIASVSKAEQLRECLRTLKRSHKDDEGAVKSAFQTLLVYVGNVAKNPDSEKFRKIRVGNPLFQNKVGRLRGGIEFLELCGFERIEEDKYLFLPRDKVNLAVLNSAGLQIKSAMSNPFFAVLSHP